MSTDLTPQAVEAILTDAERVAKNPSTARELRSSLIEVHTAARQLQREKQGLREMFRIASRAKAMSEGKAFYLDADGAVSSV